MAIRVDELGGEHDQRCGCPRTGWPRPDRPQLSVVSDRASREPAGGPSPTGRRRPTARAYAIRRGVAAAAVLLVAGLVTAGLVAAGLLTSAGARTPAAITGPARATAATATPDTVVLAPGETLWEVVAPHVPAGTDRQAFVADVLDLNDVDGLAILPGQVLTLPAR